MKFKIINLEARFYVIFWSGNLRSVDKNREPYLYDLIEQRLYNLTDEINEEDETLLDIIVTPYEWLNTASYGLITLDEITGTLSIDNKALSVSQIENLIHTCWKTLNVFKALDILNIPYPSGLSLLYKLDI